MTGHVSGKKRVVTEEDRDLVDIRSQQRHCLSERVPGPKRLVLPGDVASLGEGIGHLGFSGTEHNDDLRRVRRLHCLEDIVDEAAAG